MIDQDDHVQHTWNLTRHSDKDTITIDLWTDGENVRVDGGDHEACDIGPEYVDELLTKYQALGYTLISDYDVNDPYSADAEASGDAEPDDKPEACPECGSTVEYAQNHVADLRQGDAWLCTGCRWGQWIPV